MHRTIAATALALCLSLAGVKDLLAQRSGFIIGFGLGVGITSYTARSGSIESDRETDLGLSTDFKIGAQVSQSLQLYYLGRTNWHGSESSVVAAGISALGVTYVLPSAPIHLSGGLGLASWLEIGGSEESFSGIGLTGGIGWEFADLWLLDIAVTYGRPGDEDMVLARGDLSILTH